MVGNVLYCFMLCVLGECWGYLGMQREQLAGCPSAGAETIVGTACSLLATRA